MRLLVFPASLGVGGSQLNAVELAGAMKRRGHDVWMFGPEGPLCATIEALGLPFIPAPSRPKVRPSPTVMRELVRTVSRHSIDIVHGYEWPPILEGIYGPYARFGTAVVGTIMSMSVAPFIPRHLPLVVGTERIARYERSRRDQVWLIEPPVDTDKNHPWTEPGAARTQLGIEPRDFAVVVVSRLADELKREGILEAIQSAEHLAAEMPLRLVIVGDGPARGEMEARARAVNTVVGRPVVVLAGAMSDPRPAYAAADLAFGMGSSALRAMAFAKPTLVQGERGFWQLLTPETLPVFLEQGWYGVGDGKDGVAKFATFVRQLYADRARRDELGAFSRSVVESRFSLDRAAYLQEDIYLRTLDQNPRRRTTFAGFARPGAQVVGYEARRRWMRYRGTAPVDDFNALRVQPPATTKNG